MTKDAFDLPDMDDLASQMEDAMAEAQKAMGDLPMDGMKNVMGSLSALMGGMPAQMEELSGAMAGFGGQHEANVESLAGEPDWSVEANIQVGEKLRLIVNAAFDLEKVREAWSSTQGAGFESLVEGVVAGTAGEIETGLMGQIMGQLKKGRSIAIVEDVEVLACRIQGAPGDAAEKLQLYQLSIDTAQIHCCIYGRLALISSPKFMAFRLAIGIISRGQYSIDDG